MDDSNGLYGVQELSNGHWMAWVNDGSGLFLVEEEQYLAMTEIRKLRKETKRDEKKAERFFGIQLR